MTPFRLQAITILTTSLPLVALLIGFATKGPGANPVEDLTHVTGEWGLRWLFLSLAITPLRRNLGWSFLAPIRRTLGLAAFAYAALHLLVWGVLDLGLDPTSILEDLTERPYVMAGRAAFTILLALAVTSTRRAMKRLGRRWIRLHQAVYLAAILAVIHHFWLIKADYQPAIVESVVLAALLGLRLLHSASARRTRVSPAA